MCVIIIIPKGQKLSEGELEKAWKRNSDGSGFMYRKDGKVHYHRGYMDKDEYIEAVKPLIGKYETVLHLRISTSDAVNKLQTHPYEVGDVINQEGVTRNPVTCMNGTVKNIEVNEGCNDTMSYIIQNNALFNEFINDDVPTREKLDIIEFIKKDTSAKWCVMTPKTTYHTSGFFKRDGVLYSNLKHRNTYKTQNTFKTLRRFYPLRTQDIIKSKKLRNELNKYPVLRSDIDNYIYEYCDVCYNLCNGCLKKCKTIKDMYNFQTKNYARFEQLYIWYGSYDYSHYKKNNIFDE